jgi:type I restriction enzyme, S subunit
MSSSKFRSGQWLTTTLRELTLKIRDRDHFTPIYVEQGIPIVSPKDFDEHGRLSFTECQYITRDAHLRNRRKTDISAGDIVFTRIGARLGKAALVTPAMPEFSLLHSAVMIRPNPSCISSEYLLYVMRSEQLQSQIGSEIQSVGVPDLGLDKINSFSVTIPPPPEQRKIARILTTLDNVIEKTEALITKYQSIKQGMMHDLFSRGIDAKGTLRPTQQQAPDLYTETRIGFCPKAWKQVPLSHYADVSGGITLGRKLDSKSLVELPYLRVANVQDGYLDLSEIKTVEVLRSEVDKYKLKAGDVVMTEGGDFDKLGRGTIWQGQIADCLHQNHVFRIRPKSNELLSPFLAQLTGSAYGRHYFLMCAKQTTNLASINASQVKAFPLLLPAPEEQAAIIAKVEAIDGQLASETAQRNKLTRIKSGLMHDLLTGKVRVKVDESVEVAANA